MAVSRSGSHTFSKPNEGSITLVAGMGVVGDAHAGETVKHRSRVARDPSQPNLRQVHLIHAELFDELRLPDRGSLAADIEGVVLQFAAILARPEAKSGLMAVVAESTRDDALRERIRASIVERQKCLVTEGREVDEWQLHEKAAQADSLGLLRRARLQGFYLPARIAPTAVH